MIEGFNIPIVIREGYEADDLIATLTRAVTAESDDNRVFITTGDRDSFQLINDHVTVLYPMKGVTELASMTPTSVEAKYGLTPSQYPDFAALRGDPSDNLPSIPGVEARRQPSSGFKSTAHSQGSSRRRIRFPAKLAMHFVPTPHKSCSTVNSHTSSMMFR